ncbi:formyltransferase [Accumulibacter sp.]|uniref:formyltransferase n=1 Tax=Accumulibacter sp. TaxID=2053492 RepID=UPI0026293B22|nr:formyltransferase [Accumulibacter sp.]
MNRVSRAVVFAYHNVGARCLRVLLAHGVEVALLVSHEDDPAENVWFERVADVARDYDIPVVTPADPGTPELIVRLRELRPDFFFSFYYRRMLSPALLAIPRAAYNMHGSLLPKYRGRAPVNWALIHGERETGATLHRMVDKPDAGDMVAQRAVPILPDDTAKEVFDKVTVAAELALDRVLPALLAGTARHQALDLKAGSYFGGRKPEDGRIDWSQPAVRIHNLIRALAPPYPGAFFDLGAQRIVITRSRFLPETGGPVGQPVLQADASRLLARCVDGGILRILALEVDGEAIDPLTLPARVGRNPVPLC